MENSAYCHEKWSAAVIDTNILGFPHCYFSAKTDRHQPSTTSGFFSWNKSAAATDEPNKLATLATNGT
jgi:hypothetical protein